MSPFPRGDVMTKYSLLIAAGETPTILMEYDYPKVAQWANDGAMQVIDLDAFAKVAPTYYQAMVDNNQLGYSDINGENLLRAHRAPLLQHNGIYTYATMYRQGLAGCAGHCRADQLQGISCRPAGC